MQGHFKVEEAIFENDNLMKTADKVVALLLCMQGHFKILEAICENLDDKQKVHSSAFRHMCAAEKGL